MSRRSGLSQVEAMVVVCSLVLLVGLLLPSIMRLRERANSSTRGNKLREIMYAVQSHNDAYEGKLPPLVDIGEGAPTGAGLQSIFFNILPYLHQENIYRVFNKATPSTYYQAATANPPGAASNPLHWLINPADRTFPSGAVTSADIALPSAPPAPFVQSFTGWYATTSYAANGLIPWNTGGLPRSFVDGTSNTIMFAERPQVCLTPTGQSVYNLWGFGFYGPQTPAFALLTPDTPTGLPSTGQIAPALPLHAQWTSDSIPVRIGTSNSPPQPSPVGRPFQTGIVSGTLCDPRIPGSPHTGGMLVALADDGSVRTISPTISEWTFWAACTPDGNEAVGSDW